MKTRLPIGLVLIAVLQFVGPLILPPQTLTSVGPILWGIIAVLFTILGVNLLQRKAWARVASIFLQGFNIIVRVLVLIGHGLQGGQAGNPVDVALISTFIVSMIVSALILYYIDTPDIQVLMQ